MTMFLRQAVLIVLIFAVAGGFYSSSAQTAQAENRKALLPAAGNVPQPEGGTARAATVSEASFLTHAGSDNPSDATRPLDDAPDSTRKAHLPWAELIGIILLLGAGLFVYMEMKRLKR